ncbi:MAG: maleylpyruvate isomerase family mycothiol-dependent enzyme [Actinomycetales bacterium]|jgi:maleylpyruvate isomerase|nr:maleylpyruvate isomerase family mycothiol-dependent enzyme [Actinomycetales bacterium]
MRHTWDDVAEATDALIATVESLPEGAQFEPSLCEGWTRGHVLTHIARNAEGLGNLVTWAVTKVETPMYASAQARNDAIEAGSGRSMSTLRDDIRNASTWLGLGARALSPADDATPLTVRGGVSDRASGLATRRLREVVYHHVDLLAGYSFHDVPAALVADFLGDEVGHLSADPTAPPMILRTDEGDEYVVGDIALAGDRTAYLSGSRAALLGWLARGLTDGVQCQGGPLPELPKGS